MDNTTLALFFAYAAIGLLLYKVITLDRQLKAMDKEHRKLVADAGMALTNTLKIAFDNLKQVNQKLDRLNVIVKDNKERIQNIMVGGRVNNTTKVDKIARFRAAVDAARNNQESFNDMEDNTDE